MEASQAADYLRTGASIWTGEYGANSYCNSVQLRVEESTGLPTLTMHIGVPYTPHRPRYTSDRADNLQVVAILKQNGANRAASLDVVRHSPADALRAMGAAILLGGARVAAAGGRHLNSLPSLETALLVDARGSEDELLAAREQLKAAGATAHGRNHDVWNVPTAVRAHNFLTQYGLGTAQVAALAQATEGSLR